MIVSVLWGRSNSGRWLRDRASIVLDLSFGIQPGLIVQPSPYSGNSSGSLIFCSSCYEKIKTGPSDAHKAFTKIWGESGCNRPSTKLMESPLWSSKHKNSNTTGWSWSVLAEGLKGEEGLKKKRVMKDCKEWPLPMRCVGRRENVSRRGWSWGCSRKDCKEIKANKG